MKTQFYTWDDVPEKYKQLILAESGEDWGCSKKHGGPFVRIDPLNKEHRQAIPEAVCIRLDECHDCHETTIITDSVITVWYDLTL